MSSSSLSEPLRETLAVFEGATEPRTTPEVAERLDVGRRTAYARLKRLVEQDRLETKKVGANARVWWPSARDAAGDSEGEQWEQQFRSLVDATEEYAIFMLDSEGYIQTWNPGAERIKGYSEDEIVGEHFSTFYTEEARENGVPRGNLAAATEQGAVQDEGWRVRADGSRFWANVTITAIRDDGDLRGFAKVTRDMTDRREYEQQLQEEKAFVESLLDTQPDLLYAFDKAGTPMRWNDRFREVTGYTDDEIETMRPADFVADRATEETREAVEEVVEREERVTVELPLETKDGEEIPYEFTGGPLTDENGDVIGFTAVGRDISERKARERRLERQRSELEAELEDVFTRIDEAFFALDDEWRVTYVNDRAAELVEVPTQELLQSRIWDVLPEVAEGYPRELTERALAEQESVEFEFYSEKLDIWVEVRGYPSETGLSVYVRDITERKERERELEESRQRYRTLVEHFPNGAVALVDEDLRYRTVGGTPVDEAAESPESLEGDSLREALTDDLADLLVPAYEAALDSEERSFVTEIGDGSYQFHFVPVRDDDGDVFAAMGMSQDITERKEYERELELYETIVDTVDDGIYVLDDDFCFVDVNEAYVEMTGYDREELVGEHCSLVVDEDVAEESFERMLEIDDSGGSATLEADIHRADGSRLRAESRFTGLPSHDEPLQKVGVVRDVTEHRQRERALRDRVRQQEAVMELGQRALEDTELDDLLAETADRVAETLDTAYCDVLELDEDGEELFFREGVGWRDVVVGEATVPAAGDDSRAAYTLASEQPVIVEDLDAESRFERTDLLEDHSVESSISTIVGPAESPWGILAVHDTERREFAEHDATFVQAVANVLAAAIERHNHERELVHQREQLAALNSLNEVVRDITSAVIEQSTREEIEQTVCERLADTDSYTFAWVGDVDSNTRTVESRAEAGVDGYLDDITISVDPDDERSEGPSGRALRTGEVQVANHILSADQHDPWQSAVEEYGFRSSAAIPIIHEGTIYGVLNVYADRPGAFTDQEREMVGQLGEIVGHSIAATERKRALMSDELVELDFQIENILSTLDIPAETDGTITLDHTVPAGDDGFLVYGSATPDATDTLETLVKVLPHWRDVAVDVGEEGATFELRMADPPVLSVVASLGGYVDEAVIEGGDYRMTIHLAPSADVRRAIDAVEDAYPEAEMVRRQQIERLRDDRRTPQRLVSNLTDRQRSALEAAFHAGFFEWPREATGEDVAESLGVAPPTFHQHLRKAERKVFDAVFSSPVQNSGHA